jgi:hypothetical protein
MGRVVRGMGAMGCEGASDMAAACARGIGRLGCLATAIRGDGRASGGVDGGAAQRRQTPAKLGRAGREAATTGGPTKNSWVAEERAARFLSNDITSLPEIWRPQTQ